MAQSKVQEWEDIIQDRWEKIQELYPEWEGKKLVYDSDSLQFDIYYNSEVLWYDLRNRDRRKLVGSSFRVAAIVNLLIGNPILAIGFFTEGKGKGKEFPNINDFNDSTEYGNYLTQKRKEYASKRKNSLATFEEVDGRLESLKNSMEDAKNQRNLARVADAIESLEVSRILAQGGKTKDSVFQDSKEAGETDRYFLNITADEQKKLVEARSKAVKRNNQAVLMGGIGVGALALFVIIFIVVKKIKKKK